MNQRESVRSVTGNCIVMQNESRKPAAKISKNAHDKLESKQRFEIIKIDSRTVKYRLIKDGEKVSKKLIHKGKI